MLTKTNGMIGALLGIIVAIAGVVVYLTTVHHKTALGLLVIGVLLLAAGGYVYMTKGKAAGAR